MPEDTSPEETRPEEHEDHSEQDLPEAVIDETERLTRLAREAIDDDEAAAYRDERADLLADHDYTARVREEDNDTLVLYPEEWVEDGTVYPDRIDDVDRGIERPLEGPGAAEEWDAIEEHNRALAESVADEHGGPHGDTAHALADFASNHYAKRVEDLTREERAEFLSEYFPRNAFPSDDQKAVVEESLRRTLAAADATGGQR
jgi:hypothetical protein